MATRGRKNKDWHLLKADFITKGLSSEQLSARYGITPNWIRIIARKEGWQKEREEYQSTTVKKKIEDARKVYVRDKLLEAAKFAGLKEKLEELIDKIISDNGKGNPKDVADLSRAICQLEEREAVLCGEASQVTEGRFSANIQQVIAELGGLSKEELQKKFQEEKKRLSGAGSGMASLPPAQEKKEGE